MCTSRCGVIATVEDGKLTTVNADPTHPNGCICVKGTAAPEIVYSPDRVQYPVVRTRPKGDPNPGWVRISWKQALNLVAMRLNDIKDNYGAEAVVFSRATTAGTAAIDFDGWVQRLANTFTSPNLLTSNHICTWNRRVGSKFTYGTAMPLPDFNHTQCIMLWGINPAATSPAQAKSIQRARSRGAKLFVIDPRKTTLADKADSWLRVKPGTDGILAMAMIHVLIEEQLYDRDFARRWTNAPYLIRTDNGQLLTMNDLSPASNSKAHVVWNELTDCACGTDEPGVIPTLEGTYQIQLSNGDGIACESVFQRLRRSVAAFTPEISEQITTVPSDQVRHAVRLFTQTQPSCYCTWVGLEQHRDAMQTNRAISIFYALTGQFDQRGSNVLFDVPKMNSILGRELLPKDKVALRLGRDRHPLGPPLDPGIVQAKLVYDAILTGKPYPVKAMVLFGSDPLMGHGDSMHGKAALEAVDFYVHIDPFSNPSAQFADLLLPATTCWEREALLPSSDIADDTMDWVQLRRPPVRPIGESRSEIEIIFDLAGRLGLGEHFFNGDIEAALKHQLAPSGLTVAQLRENPAGKCAATQPRYRKYAATSPSNGKPVGFATRSGKIEIYSTVFAQAGYPPLPEFQPENNSNSDYPLTLTFFRDVHYCDEQHRNIARLRRAVPEPSLEIHPGTAARLLISDGDPLVLETPTGKAKFKGKLNETLHPEVVATVYGWWQACRELKLPGHDPFSPEGANANLLIANTDNDPISASVTHRGVCCRITPL